MCLHGIKLSETYVRKISKQILSAIFCKCQDENNEK